MLVDLGGRTVLQRSVAAFAGRADVGQIVLVTGAERFEVYRHHLAETVEAARLTLVEGGRE